MPRTPAGDFNLDPAHNPVSTGTEIEVAWANDTLDDVAQGIADSLDRYGRGGMVEPLQFADGTVSAPGITWVNAPTTGFYRAGTGDMRATVVGSDKMRLTSGDLNNPAEIYVDSTWRKIGDARSYEAQSISAIWDFDARVDFNDQSFFYGNMFITTQSNSGTAVFNGGATFSSVAPTSSVGFEFSTVKPQYTGSDLWTQNDVVGFAEPKFTKNSGFNLNLGTSASTVAEGNHTHGGAPTAGIDNYHAVVSSFNIDGDDPDLQLTLVSASSDNITIGSSTFTPNKTGRYLIALSFDLRYTGGSVSPGPLSPAFVLKVKFGVSSTLTQWTMYDIDSGGDGFSNEWNGRTFETVATLNTGTAYRFEIDPANAGGISNIVDGRYGRVTVQWLY